MEATVEKIPSVHPLKREHKALAIFVALLCLLPAVLNLNFLTKLFWFSDDLALLHDLSRLPYNQWLLERFGENIIPVFKLVWTSIVYAGNGNYVPMVTALWLCHAFIASFFALVLIKLGFSLGASFLSSMIIGLATSQSNLLFFSFHLTTALATLFTVIAGLIFLCQPESKLLRLAFALALLISLLSFSRGLIFGIALLLIFLKTWFLSFEERPKHLNYYIIVTLMTLTISLALISTTGALGSKPGLALDAAREMLNFGFHYWALSPLYLLLPLKKAIPGSLYLVIGFGVVKLLLLLVSYKAATKHSRTLAGFFLFLILVDLENTALLGWGRYTEGLNAALVPRYQRIALITFIPSLVFVFDCLLEKLLKSKTVKDSLLFIASSLLLVYFLPIWNNQFFHHSRWQGSMGRRVIVKAKLKKEELNLVPPWHGIPPVISYERSKELAKEFNLQ